MIGDVLEDYELMCANCGCYKGAHENDEGELLCPPPGTRFSLTRTPSPQVEQIAAKLLEQWDSFKASDANQQEAYYRLAKSAWGMWEELRAALSPQDEVIGGELRKSPGTAGGSPA